MMETAPPSRTQVAALEALSRERQTLSSAELDTLSALEIARIMNAEEAKVPAAVEQALPQIARAIDAIAEALANGGRLIYVGAGSSGRMAALDAAECPPTFGIDPRTVQYVMAGGEKALSRAAEQKEDSRAGGRRDLGKKKPGPRDVVVGIAASGRTPYTIAALEYARSLGARTIAVTCNRDSELEKAAHMAIVTEVGPEVLSGSTRMKAGTAQKLVLNMLSTGAMARLGYVYGNLMVNVRLKSKKLAQRGSAVLQRAAAVDAATAERALRQTGSVPVALVMLRAGVSQAEARRSLNLARGHVRHAIEKAMEGRHRRRGQR